MSAAARRSQLAARASSPRVAMRAGSGWAASPSAASTAERNGKHAFPGNRDACLVLKVLHGDWRFRRALEAEAADPRVRIIDRVFELG